MRRAGCGYRQHHGKTLFNCSSRRTIHVSYIVVKREFVLSDGSFHLAYHLSGLAHVVVQNGAAWVQL